MGIDKVMGTCHISPLTPVKLPSVVVPFIIELFACNHLR